MDICILCCDESEYFCFGQCEHRICLKCCVRSRVICGTTACPVCCLELKEVIVVGNEPPESVSCDGVDADDNSDDDIEVKYGFKFEARRGKKIVEHLLSNVCKICPGRNEFRTFAQLRDHVRGKHQFFYCGLCVKILNLFPYEHKYYTREKLAVHEKKGDPDNASYRGHPMCQFCEVRYFDDDELYKHLRQDHSFCEFCDGDGKNVFFENEDDLNKHLSVEHSVPRENQPPDSMSQSKYGSKTKPVPKQGTFGDFLPKNFKQQPVSRSRPGPDFQQLIPTQPSAIPAATVKQRRSIATHGGRFLMIDDDEEFPSATEHLQTVQKRQPAVGSKMSLGWKTVAGKGHQSGDGAQRRSGSAGDHNYRHISHGQDIRRGTGTKKDVLSENGSGGKSRLMEKGNQREGGGERRDKQPASVKNHSISQESKYVKPRAFAERNRALMEQLTLSMRDDPDRIAAFKQRSMEFQRGTLGPVGYCVWMQALIDDDGAYGTLFDELLCLLPDIGQQQHLLEAFRETGLSHCQESIRKCGKCGQWLLKVDYADHVNDAHANSFRPSNNA